MFLLSKVPYSATSASSFTMCQNENQSLTLTMLVPYLNCCFTPFIFYSLKRDSITSEMYSKIHTAISMSEKKSDNF